MKSEARPDTASLRSGRLIALFIIALTTPSAAQWQPIVQLTDSPEISATSYTGGVNGRQIAADGSNVHVVWSDQNSVGSEISYRHSTDAGETWADRIMLTNDMGTAICPVVAASAAVVHVAWTDDRDAVSRLYYRRSSDGGETWGTEFLFSSDSTAVIHPVIVTSGESAYLFWQNQTPIGLAIGFRRSTDRGASWLPEETFWRMEEPVSSGAVLHPAVAAEGNTLLCVWMNYQGAGSDLYSRRSTDGGSSWSESARITESSQSDFLPCLAMSGNGAHVLWWSRNDEDRILLYYSRSGDGGQTWKAPRTFSDVGTNRNWRARVACDGDNVHVVWADDRAGNDVFYSSSADRGERWSDEMPISEKTYGAASEPSVAVQGSQVHAVWMEKSGGSAQIFYRKNPKGNLTDIPVFATAASGFQISRNFPNPCHEHTSIQYTLTGSVGVQVTVFDLLGRRLASYNHGRQSAGTHTLRIPTVEWKPGTYYYAITAGTETRGGVLIVQ